MKNKIINSLKKNKKKILYSSNLIILLVPIGILALNKYNATINNNLNNKNWIKNNTSIIKTNIKRKIVMQTSLLNTVHLNVILNQE